jgi:hypothetical protein
MCGNRQVRGTIKRSVALIFALVTLVLFVTACPRSESKPDVGRVGISRRPVETVQGPVPEGVAFNGERALEHVRKQVEFGPRPSGSEALKRTRQYIIDKLVESGMRVTTDEFNASTPVGERKMVNITAELPGESKDLIIIASHYETKLYKDMQFVGANDPGASVGTLLELGRVLAGTNRKLKFTYWLVFFDGEESFCEHWDQCSKPDAPDNTYGSRRYVSQLNGHNEAERVKAMILLDMVGYKNLDLGRDTSSTKWLQDVIWETARELGHAAVFVDRSEGIGGDDHIPFLRAGIAAVDIIQLNSFPHWHRATDTLDKVSAQSMKIVGDVVLASLPRVEQKVLSTTH